MSGPVIALGIGCAAIMVLLVCGGIMMALLLPAIQAAREAERRAQCLNNTKQIGLAFQNMDSTRKRFPQGCSVMKGTNGEVISFTEPGCGWSWTVDLLPYMENRPLYQTLDRKNATPLTGYGDMGDSSFRALGTPVKEFSCPSFGGEMWVDPVSGAEYITNYKVSGATHAASLAQATMISPKPEPGYPGIHPDGACYPGSMFGTDGFARDGTAHTALVVETTEPYYARWTVGRETILVGLPDCVQFTAAVDNGLPYAAPVGYSKNCFWDRSTIPPDNNMTYLLWDYGARPYDERGVLSAPGGLVAEIPPAIPNSVRNPPKAVTFGPSSHHSGVINHGFADGSVQSLSEEIDAAAYMFLITRNGGDPNAPID